MASLKTRQGGGGSLALHNRLLDELECQAERPPDHATFAERRFSTGQRPFPVAQHQPGVAFVRFITRIGVAIEVDEGERLPLLGSSRAQTQRTCLRQFDVRQPLPSRRGGSTYSVA